MKKLPATVVVRALLFMSAVIVVPATAFASPVETASPLPKACAMVLKGEQPRVRCVVSGDQGLEKQPPEVGSQVIWDRIISDPDTLRDLRSTFA
ncbi:hypothetical protein [Cupriavidus pauculus]|uniref:hypothetical protein n=1 Tax=Cupriavidus pauculus TaxID=82633 RepID=UPI0038573633